MLSLDPSASPIDLALRADEAARRTALRLEAFNLERLIPGVESSPVEVALADVEEWTLSKLEREFLEAELQAVRARAATAPTDPGGFVAWFEDLRETGPGQGDPLFDWLATSASYGQMVWFLRQEIAGEAGFEDLVALTQVKLPARAKLELARNFWDEMGQGQASAMHGPMLARLGAEIGGLPDGAHVVWESIALANLMMGLASSRRHAFRSIGALGVIELTAPGRASRVNAGLKRLGFSGETRRYYALHATLDIKHSVAWNREVLWPLVAESPERARPSRKARSRG